MTKDLGRRRPNQRFRVKMPFGPYSKGHIFEPTGEYRRVLLARGLIEPVEDEVPALLAPPVRPVVVEPAPLELAHASPVTVAPQVRPPSKRGKHGIA
jgi:hypothetical protein